MSARERRGRSLDDSGGAELFVLVSVLAMLAALSLVVDGGGYMRARDQAAWCAQQAARAAAQRIDLGQVQATGQAPGLVGASSAATAQQAASGAGMVASTTVNADGSVTVTCSAQYQPVVYTPARTTTWAATEQATARLVGGITQEE